MKINWKVSGLNELDAARKFYDKVRVVLWFEFQEFIEKVWNLGFIHEVLKLLFFHRFQLLNFI